MADQIRMNTVCLAMVTLGQSPCLWAGGSELLRSKSLDACSCDSGDHFNAIDWSGRTNGWGRGLPPAGRNFDRWVIQAGLLAHPDLTPSPSDIASFVFAFVEGYVYSAAMVRNIKPISDIFSVQ